MSNFSKIVRTGVLCGACFLSGYKFGDKNNSGDYSIQSAEGRYFLQDRESDKEYEILRIDGETYIGDAGHNLDGMRALASYEFSNRRPEIRDSQERDTIDQIILDAQRLISGGN